MKKESSRIKQFYLIDVWTKNNEIMISEFNITNLIPITQTSFSGFCI
jgi:hypothetical protein